MRYALLRVTLCELNCELTLRHSQSTGYTSYWFKYHIIERELWWAKLQELYANLLFCISNNKANAVLKNEQWNSIPSKPILTSFIGNINTGIISIQIYSTDRGPTFIYLSIDNEKLTNNIIKITFRHQGPERTYIKVRKKHESYVIRFLCWYDTSMKKKC